jgi:hypothetical protein
MGQDGEEAAELVATIRGEHVVMKNWFMGPSAEAAALRSKYGPYPGLWKEVLNWPGYRDARKAYLQATQSNNNNSAGSNDNNDGPRKRRSRWGSATEDDGQIGEESSNKRRSRWDRASTNGDTRAPPPPPPSLPISIPNSLPVSGTPGMPKPLPGLGLPGMPANLTSQQQEEMENNQSRLRIINEKLATLDQEAARADALPRGHRDRSPSPPPGTPSHFVRIL